MKPAPPALSRLKVPAAVSLTLRFALGIGLGFFAHYLFYRVALPVEPFIYVAF